MLSTALIKITGYMQQTELTIPTKGRNFYNITERIDGYIATTKISQGCVIYLSSTHLHL